MGVLTACLHEDLMPLLDMIADRRRKKLGLMHGFSCIHGDLSMHDEPT